MSSGTARSGSGPFVTNVAPLAEAQWKQDVEEDAPKVPWKTTTRVGRPGRAHTVNSSNVGPSRPPQAAVSKLVPQPWPG